MDIIENWDVSRGNSSLLLEAFKVNFCRWITSLFNFYIFALSNEVIFKKYSIIEIKPIKSEQMIKPELVVKSEPMIKSEPSDRLELEQSDEEIVTIDTPQSQCGHQHSPTLVHTERPHSYTCDKCLQRYLPKK